MIIGICGELGSGKSTLAQYIVEKYGFEEYSFASPLKKIGEIFGFTHEQLYGTQENKLEIHPHWGISSRTFLQEVGTKLFRIELPKAIPEMKIEHTIWVELFKIHYLKNKGNISGVSHPNIVISDVRFLDEAKVIKELGGIIIRVVRNNNVFSDSKKEAQHTSEVELRNIKEDFLIDNNVLSKEEAQKKFDSIYNFY